MTTMYLVPSLTIPLLKVSKTIGCRYNATKSMHILVSKNVDV